MKSAELIRRRFPWGGDLDNRNVCLKYLAQGILVAEDLQIENVVNKGILRLMACNSRRRLFRIIEH